MAPKKVHYCRCDRYCKGIERVVSRSNYYLHRSMERQGSSQNEAAGTVPVLSAQSALADRDVNQPDRPHPSQSILSNSVQSIGANEGESGCGWTDPSLDEQESGWAGASMDAGNATGAGSDSGHLGDTARQSAESESMAEAFQPELQPHPARFDDSLPPGISSCIPELSTALEFRYAIESASLDNGDMSPDQLDRLRNPGPLVKTLDRDTRLSIKLFLSTVNAADSVYENVRLDMLEDEPERDLLSFHSVKKEVANLTGVTPIVHHMCPNTCMAYTGPFSELQECRSCNTTRYDPKTKKPRQYFYTMPLGPQLQERWKEPQSAHLMGHRARETSKIFEQLNDPANGGSLPEYSDIYHGQDYLEAVDRGDIRPSDSVLLFSMDGAQLYRDKKSDCWIYIWVLLDLPPEERYKKRNVLPGAVIPGPNNPEHMESFLFPGFHHLAALQKEGLRIINGATSTVEMSNLFLLLGSADGPGGTYFTGFVGHHGYFFCRLYCGIHGRHKPEGSHYYGALLKPNNYNEDGCNHSDINASTVGGPLPEMYQKNLVFLLGSTGKTNYKARRKETGLSSTSIFSGLASNRRLPVPCGFVGDSMHVPTLNLGDLLVPLWRGKFQVDPGDDVHTWDWAVLSGKVWEAHGAAVGASRQYLPGSFDRPPRNIADKVSSGYKAKEWQHYFYGLAVPLLYGILPFAYWRNLCKLVYAVRILHQHIISRPQLQSAHRWMSEFHQEFELLYVQRKVSRLHFMRPCLHFLLHMPGETVRTGPVPLSSTWTMERMIGDLGGQIKQPSNPYHNLSERGLRQCQINTLTAAYPDLARSPPLTPSHSDDLGDGFLFLSARERTPRTHHGEIGDTLREYFIQEEAIFGNVPPAQWLGPKIRRWARLKLPNGQVARSAWKEQNKPPEKVRQARCVKLLVDGEFRFGEILFFFNGEINGARRPLAMVSLLSPHDKDLFELSHWTLMSVHKEERGLRVVSAKSILSVVAMIPWAIRDPEKVDQYFIYEQLGMEISLWSESLENEEDEADGIGDDED